MTVPGLRKFDLGTIPAPVTPPPSWRRAAWFAVGSSVAVVVGLVLAAASLVGKPKNTDTIDALPGYPSLPIFFEPSVPSTAPGPHRPTTPGRGAERPTAPATTAQPTTRTSPAPRQSSSGPGVTIPAVPGTTGTAGTPAGQTGQQAPPAPPVRQTTPKRAFASNDPEEIGDRTEAFYQQVTTDPAAAFQMTTGDIRQQGEQAFRERYAGIKSVEVRRIGIDPNQGTTVSEIRVTRADGSSVVEHRQLRFTSGSNPKISSEVTH